MKELNLNTELLKEHTKEQRDKITTYIGNDPKRFAQLMDLFLKGPYRITQRAAWPLGRCVENNPALIRPYWKTILTYIQQPGIHHAVKRNVLRMFQFVEIPKAHQGIAIDVCFRFLTHAKEPVAIKVFAMTVLANLAKKSPEIKNELVPIIEDQLPFASAGFISRSRKLLKQLR